MPKKQLDKHTGKHPDAVAWDEFRSAKENRGMFVRETLGNTHVYLENRLNRAFQAGIEHGRKTPNVK